MQQAGSFDHVGSAVSHIGIEVLSSSIASWAGGLQAQAEVGSQGQAQRAARCLLAAAVCASVLM